jgi:hypothetical protein
VAGALAYRDKYGLLEKVEDTPEARAAIAAEGGRIITKADQAKAAQRAEDESLTGQAAAAGGALGAGFVSAVTAPAQLGATVGKKTADWMGLGAPAPGLIDETPAMPDLSGRTLIGKAIGAVGGDETEKAYHRGSRALAEANPVTSTVAGIGGQMLGFGATGAFGLAHGAGEATAGLATRALGAANVAPKAAGILSRLAGATMGGAVEGGLFGTAEAGEDAWREDKALTAEMVWAGAGHTAMLGGAVAGGFAGLGEAWKGGRAALAARRAAKLEGAAPEGAAAVRPAAELAEPGATISGTITREGDDAATAIREAAGAEKATMREIQSAPKDALAKAYEAGAPGRRALPDMPEMAKGIIRGEDVVTKTVGRAAEDIAPKLNEINKTVGEIADFKHGRFSTKLEDAAKQLEGGDFAAEAPMATRQVADEQIAKVRQLLADDPAAGAPFRKLEASLTKLRPMMDDADPAMVRAVADQMRAETLGVAQDAWRVSRTSMDATARARAVGQTYDALRNTLGDESLWGKVGADFRAFNEADRDIIATQGRFGGQGMFFSKTGEGAYMGEGLVRPILEANEGSIMGSMRKMATPEGAFDGRQMTRLFDSQERFLTSAKSMSLAPEQAAKVDAALKQLSDARSTFAGVSNKLDAARQAGEFLAETKNVGAGLGKFGIVEKAASPAVRAVTSIQLQISAQRVRQTFESLIDSAVEKTVAAAPRMRFGAGIRSAARDAEVAGEHIRETLGLVGKKAAEEGVKVATAAERGSEAAHGPGLARRAIVPASIAAGSMAYFQGKEKSPEDAYRKRAGEVLAATQNMAAPVRDAVAKYMGPMTTQAPIETMHAVGAATRGAMYLQEKLPVGLTDPKSFTPRTSRPTPSADEIQTFARIYEAVNKPLAVARDFANGTVTRDQVDALKTVYPAIYSWMQTETMKRLSDMDARGVEVPYEKRQIFDMLFDLDGAGERTLEPDFAAKYGPAIGAKLGPSKDDTSTGPAPRPGPTKLGTRYQTGTDRLLGGQG